MANVFVLEEPEGWKELQELAQRENDPQKLAHIIDEMNRLLTDWENRAGGRETLQVCHSDHSAQ